MAVSKSEFKRHAASLIGQRVNLVKQESEWRGHTMVGYKMDDPLMKDRFDKLLGSWRIKLPGCVYTQDYRPDRSNVHVDVDTGLITEIRMG